MRRREFIQDTGLAAGSLLLGGCGRGAAPSLTSNRLNVLMILSDALRADRVGCYGGLGAATPNVDALADRGVAFSNFLSSSPATGPAHASLVTGTYPTQHGVMLNEGRMNEGLATLAETLGHAGYETAAVISNPVLSRRTGLGIERGFGLYDDEMPSLEKNRGKPFRAAPETTAAAIRWLEADRKRPFFLWVHLMEPHGPYELPDPSWLEKVGDAAPLPGDPERLGVLETNRGPGGIPKYQVLGVERVPSRYRAHYAARACYVDHHVGQILDAARRKGLDRNTVILFLSDHGELMGERGYYFQHGTTLLRDVLHVPLVIAAPGVAGNARVPDVVGMTDVLPTILDLLEVRWGRLDAQVEGGSLAPLLRGQAARGKATRYAFCQYGRECTAIRGGLKYTVGGEERPAARLTNHFSDPLEETDLAPGQPRTASEMRADLDRLLSRAPDLFVRGKGASRELGEEDRERLRSLGYLQ
jgi:arylsulfatase A-like enzyme